MLDNLSSVRVCDADIIVSKDLLASTCDLVASDCDLANSDTVDSKDLAVASCDIMNWDIISSSLEMGRDCGVGPLLCLVSKATSSCSSSCPIKSKDCEAI